MNPSIIEEPIAVDAEEYLSKAFGLLQQKKDDYFFVTRNGEYAGVVDSRVLRDFFGDPAQTKAKSVMAHAPLLVLNETDEEVVRKLLSTRTKALPIVDKKNRLVGAVTRWKALELLKSSPLVHGKKVKEVMSSPAITISDEARIAKARNVMKQNSVFRLVVTNNVGEAIGMLSAFDIETKVQPSIRERRKQYYYFPTPKLRLDEEPVRLIMTEPLNSVSSKTPVLEAVKLFQEKGVSSLAVLEDKKPKGIVTLRDVYEICLVPESVNVRIEGLEQEERVFKASLENLATGYWDKIAHRLSLQPDDELIVHIKTKNIGGRRREHEVKSRLTVKGRVYATRPKDRPEHFKNWDLQAVVKESLEELTTIVLGKK